MSHAVKTLSIVAVLALVVSACSTDDWGQGGPASPSPSAASPTPITDAFDDPEHGRGGPGDDDDSDVGEPLPVVGKVHLNWEVEHVSNRLFSYDATVCDVDNANGNVMVQATGFEDGTDNPSTLDISVSPDVLEHPGTGTYLGTGHVTFTADGQELVADGRVYTSPEGIRGPSMFHYRFDHDYAEFRAQWWDGEDEGGTGAVTIECTM